MAQKNVLKYIILGLLNREELAGYDIKKLFEEELGDFWYSNHSQIYPELRRMEEDGLISSRTELVGKKLEKKFYQITKDGQKLLSAWMDEPLNPPVPTRDEFTMKLYLLDSADHPLVTRLFQEEIARHEEKYQYLQARWQLLFADEKEQHKHFGHRCILQQAILREKQRLEWLHQELKNIKQTVNPGAI
ncbi:PadR family transcriptional regulator [Selenomonas sp. ND2010]|jgi:DNA-binding PadR family transcriptional regulator|uniref:PadR family transcriptional regulator n=1 Tax=Selenomonas sp. ND2010 TaxID=1410618 RepID=UPI00051BBFB7|nr:PadR family transcriptional regulator [Selenomonas sp. ND2010]